MTETRTTATPRPAHSAGVLAHGVRAVVDLMAAGHLPVPLDISGGRERPEIHVVVASVDLQPWLDVIHVDDITHTDLVATTTITYHGRTEMGVRVAIRVVAARLSRATEQVPA